MNLAISNLYCTKCNNKMPIPRKRSERRPTGHIKHMWCFKCKCVQAHVEQRCDYNEICS